MEDTRERLLTTGLQMLHEEGVVAGVDHVKLATVCERASYTTGAAYRCWPSQGEFHRDLAMSAILWRDRPSVSDLVKTVRKVIDARCPLAEALRIGAREKLTNLHHDAGFVTSLALRAGVGGDATLREACASRVKEGLDAHEDLFLALLTVYRRRMREPYTVRHLVTLIAALAEGFFLQDLPFDEHPVVTRDDVGDDVGREWTLFGVGLQLVVDGLTEEDPSATGDVPVAGCGGS